MYRIKITLPCGAVELMIIILLDGDVRMRLVSNFNERITRASENPFLVRLPSSGEIPPLCLERARILALCSVRHRRGRNYVALE